VSDHYIAIKLTTLLVVVYAATRGDSPEKWCAAAIGAEALLDLLLHVKIGHRTFTEFEPSRMVFDIAVACVFMAIGLRANRLYPSAMAATQILAVIGSVPLLLSNEGWGLAYWAMTNVPLYILLVLLAGGTLAHRRRLARIGPYNCWSPRADGSFQFI
jgi:hypothetical protein